MIDVVFQLLAFFIMTLKIVTLEGDFDVTMPPKSQQGAAADNTLLPMRVRLRADENGDLAAIEFEGQQFATFAELNHYVHSIVGDPRGPDSAADAAEVEIDADYELHYQHTVGAITAVSGFLDEQGNIVKMIDKIKFAPVRRD